LAWKTEETGSRNAEEASNQRKDPQQKEQVQRTATAKGEQAKPTATASNEEATQPDIKHKQRASNTIQRASHISKLNTCGLQRTTAPNIFYIQHKPFLVF
jgi:hypothetical protein